MESEEEESGSEELFPDYGNDESDASSEEGFMPVDDDDDDDLDLDLNLKVNKILHSAQNEADLEDEDGIAADAWGKKRQTYYSTDYVDKDFGGFEGSDAELAEQEEEEAISLQKQLIEQLDEADFGTSIFQKTDVKQSENEFGKVSIDVSELNKAEKLKLLNTESPELIRIIEDMKEKFRELREFLTTMEQNRLVIQNNERVNSFCNTKVQILLHYCMNVAFYLSMKAKKSQISNHPVKKRILNFQQLLEQLTNLPEIKLIGNDLKQLCQFSSQNFPKLETKPTKKRKVAFKDIEESKLELNEDEIKKEDSFLTGENQTEKRAISHQIAKNRGLTPHRKKEYKNPRVKHRMKFKKAKSRRRGQVREPRQEIKRYDGEIAGIKIGVRKGIKLK